ncbi:FHA domain-containing protein [Plantactinospora endophytica]|uniref:FHA domain-containing protein n=1 Tax=Plantactinospora endophytica TaxID=673535 RepID=A0ABQ4E8X3_9ACTN|nr:FHA domain-containing protein [Plantactinospora endophytica]GIG91185.1 hypothetical protein Pen02_61210 [Plantactinospora endophytica]
MTATTCPRGHESTTVDYCDVCGVPMSRGAAGPAPDGTEGAAPAPGFGTPAQASGGLPAGGASESAGESAPATPCPVCGAPQAGRFCEEDGYDFLLAPPVSPAPTGTPGAGGVGPTGTAPEPSAFDNPGGVPAGSAPATSGSVEVTAPGADDTWQLVVDADRGYFDLVTSFGGTDAGSLSFPRFVVPRRFTLERRQLLIGRRSRSRGVRPDIDLVGPPEDPGVSHLHALLVPLPEGWAVVDLESANGTYLNDPAAAPIVANTPIPLGDGDRVYLGAWTRLTIRTAGRADPVTGPPGTG